MNQNISIAPAASSFGPYAQALAALVVGLAVAYVAYQQWRTATTKLRFDLFEKRFAIYELCGAFVKDLAVYGHSDHETRQKLNHAALQSQFLFGKRMMTFISSLTDLAEDEDEPMTRADLKRHTPLKAEEATEILQWASNVGWQMDEVFAPYLRLDKLIFWRKGKLPVFPPIPKPLRGPEDIPGTP